MSSPEPNDMRPQDLSNGGGQGYEPEPRFPLEELEQEVPTRAKDVDAGADAVEKAQEDVVLETGGDDEKNVEEDVEEDVEEEVEKDVDKDVEEEQILSDSVMRTVAKNRPYRLSRRTSEEQGELDYEYHYHYTDYSDEEEAAREARGPRDKEVDKPVKEVEGEDVDMEDIFTVEEVSPLVRFTKLADEAEAEQIKAP